MRRAFTLIELVVAILILSILMLFLYKSYADLNRANKTYGEAVEKLHKKELFKKTFYLDLLLAYKKSLIIKNIDREFDFISFMSKNSLHRRINPYVSYIVRDETLYRLESLKQIVSTDIDRDTSFDVDKIAKIKKIKLFGTRDEKKDFYLLDLRFANGEKLLFKIRVLN